MKKQLSILFLFVCTMGIGQNTVDSLFTLIKTDREDTNKLHHLHKITSEYIDLGEFNSALQFGKQELNLAQGLDFKTGIAQAYNAIGIISEYQGNYPEALKNYFAALKINEALNDKKGASNSYSNIGIVYALQGNYPEATKNNFASLKLSQEINDKKGIARSYNNIGIVYCDQRNYTEALKNHFASLKIKEELNDVRGLANTYINIGNIYYDQGNYPEALKNFFASSKINEELGDKEGIATSYLNLGQLYTKLKNTKDAQNYLNKALELGKEIGSIECIEIAYENLTVLDSATAKYKAAFEHHKLFILYRDSINNEETQKKSLEASMQYEFDKKEIATKAEQDKLDAISSEEKQKQKLLLLLVCCILVLVAIFAVFMFKRFRITQRQKVIIEKQKKQVDKAYEALHEKNKEVMDSINYASRIQRALITSEKYITKQLERLMKNN